MLWLWGNKRERARERRSRDNYFHLRGRAKESDTKRRPMTSGNLWGPATASILFLSDCSCLVLVSVCVAQRLRARFLLSDGTRRLVKTGARRVVITHVFVISQRWHVLSCLLLYRLVTVLLHYLPRAQVHCYFTALCSAVDIVFAERDGKFIFFVDEIS